MAGSGLKALTLLAVLLCLEEAWAIKCHNCTNLNGSCEKETVCPANSRACFSQRTSATIGGMQQTATHKMCVISCDNITPVDSRQNLVELQISAYCCDTDLCNAAGAQGPGATTVGLTLVASVLTTLMGASV